MILSVSFKLKTKRGVTRVTRSIEAWCDSCDTDHTVDESIYSQIARHSGQKGKAAAQTSPSAIAAAIVQAFTVIGAAVRQGTEIPWSPSQNLPHNHTRTKRVFSVLSRSAQLSRRLQKNIERQIDRATGHSTGSCCDATVKQYYGTWVQAAKHSFNITSQSRGVSR